MNKIQAFISLYFNLSKALKLLGILYLEYSSRSSQMIAPLQLIQYSALLSGDNNWINPLPQKRYTVHIDRCDIWIDLRPFLNFLVQPFSTKLRSMEAKGLKSGNLGKQIFFLKYQHFVRFNFVSMYYGQFPPKSSLKLRFVLF